VMPMPEKILDEKAQPVKTNEALNQTAPSSDVSKKVEQMVSDTKRLSIDEKAQEPVLENKAAELKETKSKIADPADEAKPVEAKPVESP